MKLSCVAAGVKPVTPGSLDVRLICASFQAQVAAAATALSTLAIAVAPAAQAAQEAFVVAEVRRRLHVLLLLCKQLQKLVYMHTEIPVLLLIGQHSA